MPSELTLEIDTGAEVSSINLAMYNQVFKRSKFARLKPSNIIMTGFGGSTVKAVGQLTVYLGWKGKGYKETLQVTPINSPNVLSRKMVLLMGILVPQFPVKQRQDTKVSSNIPQSTTAI